MKDYRTACPVFIRVFVVLFVAYYCCTDIFYSFRFGFTSLTFFVYEKIDLGLFVLFHAFEVSLLPMLYIFFKNKIISYISLAIQVIQLSALFFLLANNGIEKAMLILETEHIVWQFALFFNLAFIVLFVYRIVKLPTRFPKRNNKKDCECSPSIVSGGIDLSQNHINNNIV